MHELIKEVKTLKSNSDYRVNDIIYKLGGRWEHSLNKVLTKKIFKNSILQNYLLRNQKGKLNLNLFIKCIKEFQKKNNIKIPEKDELVIHLRLGDVIVHDWFLSKDYISLIKNICGGGQIKKISIVTCFAFCEWSKDSLNLNTGQPLWEFNESKEKANKEALNDLINKIENTFNYEIQVISNLNPDYDICYCVFANYLITDHGGFSNLLKDLNGLNKLKIIDKIKKLMMTFKEK